VRVVASEHRSQRQNRDAAEARLAGLVAQALVVPKRRKPTKPTRASVARRLDAKRKQSYKKRDRRGEY
jgi:ribosome-associated protein